LGANDKKYHDATQPIAMNPTNKTSTYIDMRNFNCFNSPDLVKPKFSH